MQSLSSFQVGLSSDSAESEFISSGAKRVTVQSLSSFQVGLRE